MTGGINDLWQADLMEMIPYSKINKGYKYILNIIDVFSRYVRAAPLRQKSAVEVSAALEKIFQQTKPRHLQTDQGKEFYNASVQRLLERYKINHYSVYSKQKCAHVERFNRTLRSKLNRYFTFTGKKVWHSALGELISTYNKSPHRGINKIAPQNVTAENEMALWQSQNTTKQAPAPPTPSTIKVHDYCRISRDRGAFLKNFDQNWSEEIFQIIAIDSSTSPVMYYLHDLKGEQIKGKFYKQELQVVAAPSDVYRIEKVLQTRGRGKHKQHLVKWYGYKEKSWIPANAIIKPP
jgi:hypothetical protein